MTTTKTKYYEADYFEPVNLLGKQKSSSVPKIPFLSQCKDCL